MRELDKALRGKRCLLFIDLEGTQTTHEMIEIGAYKVLLKPDGTVKKVFKPYHAFVLAKHRIGPIVTKLTGITDFQLKKEGIPFRLVQQQLKKYLGKDYGDALLVSYGAQDAHIILASAENNMDASMDDARLLSRHFFDLAEFVARFVRDDSGNLYSLTNILKIYQVEFQGAAHSALNDAYNLLLLYQAFLARPDITAEQYKKLLTHYNHAPVPVIRVLQQLNRGEAVTPEDWARHIEASLQ